MSKRLSISQLTTSFILIGTRGNNFFLNVLTKQRSNHRLHKLNHISYYIKSIEEEENESSISVLETNIVFTPKTIERSSGLASRVIVNSRVS